MTVDGCLQLLELQEKVQHGAVEVLGVHLGDGDRPQVLMIFCWTMEEDSSFLIWRQLRELRPEVPKPRVA